MKHEWLNAWLVAQPWNARPYVFLTLASTRAYLDSLSRMSGKPPSHYYKIKMRGSRYDQATLIAPDLILPFARWLDPTLAAWIEYTTRHPDS